MTPSGTLDDQFLSNGHLLVDGSRPVLDEIYREVREAVEGSCRRLINKDLSVTSLSSLHDLGLDAAELNRVRLASIADLSAGRCNELVYSAFRETIERLVGADVLMQRTVNLVIQTPNDPNPSEFHRDAPANSPYEMVLWVPLVDIDTDMALYLLDVATSRQAARMLSDARDWLSIKSRYESVAVKKPMNFGQGLVFWTGLFHGSFINCSAATRVSLNVRFKSVGTPFGEKEPTQFFRVLKLSPLTRLGLEFERDVG